MRTTLVIDDRLMVSVKKLAAERGTSVSAVVGEALRRFLQGGGAGRGAGGEPVRFVTPTFGGDGVGGTSVDTAPGECRRLELESESEFSTV